MPPILLITLTTDFGEGSPYVAAMKGVILSLNRSVRIVDVTHASRRKTFGAGRSCSMKSRLSIQAVRSTWPWSTPASARRGPLSTLKSAISGILAQITGCSRGWRVGSGRLRYVLSPRSGGSGSPWRRRSTVATSWRRRQRI
jgi:hypothetical protein